MGLELPVDFKIYSEDTVLHGTVRVFLKFCLRLVRFTHAVALGFVFPDYEWN